MSNIIVVRVLPITPTTGAQFTTTLQNLTLTAYDRTVKDTSPNLVTGQNDVLLGVATGLAPQGVDPITSSPGAPVLEVVPGPAYLNSIIQHYENNAAQPTPWVAKAAATALIVVTADLSTQYEDFFP